jgi:hypothetical protein
MNYSSYYFEFFPGDECKQNLQLTGRARGCEKRESVCASERVCLSKNASSVTQVIPSVLLYLRRRRRRKKTKEYRSVKAIPKALDL